MGITCTPWDKTRGMFVKLQNELDSQAKADKKVSAKENKKKTTN